MFAGSKSHMSIQYSVFINNHLTKVIYHISQNSALRTNYTFFLRNNMPILLDMTSKCSAIIKNSTLSESNVK